jgi:hypothetical protein
MIKAMRDLVSTNRLIADNMVAVSGRYRGLTKRLRKPGQVGPRAASKKERAGSTPRTESTVPEQTGKQVKSGLFLIRTRISSFFALISIQTISGRWVTQEPRRRCEGRYIPPSLSWDEMVSCFFREKRVDKKKGFIGKVYHGGLFGTREVLLHAIVCINMQNHP